MIATKQIIRSILCIGLAASVLGCADRYPETKVPPMPSISSEPQLYKPTIESEYLIQVGDSLSIKSYFNSNLNQDVIVLPDGRISLILLRDVMAAGKTAAELTRELEQGYGTLKYLNSPDVTVVVKELSNEKVYVDGEVKYPAVVAMKGPMTLMQSIATVGGIMTTANTSQVLLIRRQATGEAKTYQFDMQKVLKNEVPDIYLRRADIVYVPRSDIAEANLWVNMYLSNMLPSWLRNDFNYLIPVGSQSTTVTTK